MGVGNKIENKAETDCVPLFPVLNGIHEQEVLLLDRWMAGVQVDGRHIYPCRTRGVIVGFERADLEKSAGTKVMASQRCRAIIASGMAPTEVFRSSP